MTDSPPPQTARGSLILRTLLLLGAGLTLAVVALLLLFRPYLASAFERETETLLQEQELRARTVAELDTATTDAVLGDAISATYGGVERALDEEPLELITPEHERVRAALRARTAELRAASGDKLDALAEEIRIRKRRALDAELGAVQESGRERVPDFGDELSLRAAALVLAALACVFLALGVLLLRTVVGPVSRLSEAARGVTAGRLDTRIPVQGDDEVAGLALSFDTMLDSLAAAQAELRALNAELEDRVAEKTAALSGALEESRSANRRLEEALQQLRTTEKELRQAEKMASLGTLAGGVAHEFNNLLGGILGCAEDARSETDPDDLRETLGVIERAARRGTAITDNLLRFARPSQGERETVDLRALLGDVATLVEPEASRHGVTVELVPGAEPVATQADASGLHQVLLNLATNALHAMPDGGRLTFEARNENGVQGEGGDARVVVRDTGVGIDPAHRERLFEPFFSTRGPEGTGLGLSVSYGIVTSHGGRIEVDSEPGHGAQFTLVLPAAGSNDGGAE